jgi:hypothetical protein
MTTVSSGTPKGCPAPTTNIVGYITGPGAWANGILGVSNTDTGVSLASDFGVELSDSFFGIAQSNGLTITAGKYTITVYCVNDLGTTRFGEFAAPVWFTDATKYQSTDPALPTPGPTTPAPTTSPTIPAPTTSPTSPAPTSPAPTLGPTPVPSGTTPAPSPGGSPVATTTTLSASPAGTAAQGAPVTLTASLSPQTAAGTVTFRDGTGTAATVLGTSTVVSGVAVLTTAVLAAGSHSLTASFAPALPGGAAPSQSAPLAYVITAAAAPGSLGTLLVGPPIGTAGDPIYFETQSLSSRATKGCPTPATNVSGVVTGPQGWAGGILLVQNTDTGVSTTAEFSVAAADTFTGLAASNGIQVVPGRYDIAVYCQDDLGVNRYGQFTASIWFTDSTRYQSNDPATSQTPTQTVVTTSPEDRADVGTAVTLTATVTPASATGSVQFRTSQNGTFAPIGNPVPLSGGKATISSTSLVFALYQFSAVFTPSDATKLTTSASKDVVFVVALPIPPVPKARAVVTGKVKAGSTVSCSASFTNAKSLRYEWIRDRETTVGGAGRSYRLVAADAGHAIRCRAFATNTGGTTSRTSRAIRVAG